MLQRIHEVSEPVIGRYYLVQCLQSVKPGLWLPVIGPEHEDAAIIKFPALHCHYDLRFFPARLLASKHLRDYTEYPATNPLEFLMSAPVLTLRGSSTWPDSARGYYWFHISSPVPEWKRRKCLRETPVFPWYPSAKGWPRQLEACYANVVLKDLDNPVCPHRGIPLKGHGQGDQVVCPGHGLKWNLKTGRMVSRLQKLETAQEGEITHDKALA